MPQPERGVPSRVALARHTCEKPVLTYTHPSDLPQAALLHMLHTWSGLDAASPASLLPGSGNPFCREHLDLTPCILTPAQNIVSWPQTPWACVRSTGVFSL